MSEQEIQLTSALVPGSTQAGAIKLLMVGVILMAIVVAGLVSSLVAIAIVRFRDRGGGVPEQCEGNRGIEVAYTAIPLVIMTVLFICTVSVMRLAEPATAGRTDLVIVAHQWWWELRYPDSGIVSANEIHLPVGVPFTMELRSADVIHEFWVPQLGPKMDAVPGQINRLLLKADTPGIYLGTCGEFCGAQHAGMRLRVIVETRDEFERWEESQRRLPDTATGLAAQGRALLLSRSCAECHAIAETSAKGIVGPDLTHFASRATLASGVLDNTPENLRRWLDDPQAVKPRCHMPNMKLSNSELEAAVVYLESLK